MRRIRIGNEFTHLWVLERLGEPENLNIATEVILMLKTQFGSSKVITYDVVNSNVVRVRFTTEMMNKLADYTLVLEYYMPDGSMHGGRRHNAVNVKCFTLVATSEEADADVDEFTSTSDVAIGLRGADAFQVWQSQAGNEGKTYDDYIAYLREPMTAAIAEGEQTAAEWAIAENARREAEEIRIAAEGVRNDSEILRVSSENIRYSNENTRNDNELQRNSNENIRISNALAANNAEALRLSAELLRISAESNRTSAETARVNSEALRVTAENNRVSAEALRVTAENNRVSAENIRVSAENIRISNEAARVALGAEVKTNKTSDIEANKTSVDKYPNVKGVVDVIIPAEQVTAESLTVLNRRIEALETIIANSQYSKIDVLDEFNFFGKTNLILFGVTSPSITPDFIGQFYINTTAGITYQAKGVTNSGDWKQTSN